MIRRLIPQLLVPLALIANLIAADPWLRAFPVSVAAVPLLGAAVLSRLAPAATHRLRPRPRLGGCARRVPPPRRARADRCARRPSSARAVPPVRRAPRPVGLRWLRHRAPAGA